MLAAAE